MKVAITGHTRGIGRAIAELYPDHIGFSRSNGYDISIQTLREQIVSESSDCDVFVNNAHCLDNQTTMFEEIFDAWRNNKSKTIINIGSRAIYEDVNKDKSENFLSAVSDQGNYIAYKSKLSEVSNPGNSYNRQCRIININPGWVATDKVPEAWLIEQDYPYMTSAECAKYVKWAIDQDLEIGELSFWRSK
jgi:hypothetical protein